MLVLTIILVVNSKTTHDPGAERHGGAGREQRGVRL